MISRKELLKREANKKRLLEESRLAREARKSKQEKEKQRQYYVSNKQQLDDEYDRNILNQLDVNKLDISKINTINNASVRSRLQHEYNLRPFRKTLNELNTPSKNDEIVAEALNVGIENLPKVGQYYKDSGIRISAPQINDKIKDKLNEQYDELLQQNPELAYELTNDDLKGGNIHKRFKHKIANGKYHCKLCKKTVKSYASHAKSKRHLLKAGGLISYLKKKYNQVKNFVTDKFRKKLDGFNNTSTATLKKFGDFPIISLRIFKKPIHKVLDKVIDFISLGKWSEVKDKYGFDQLYHLGCLASINVNGTHKTVQFEKVESVKFFDGQHVSGSDVEYLDVPMNKQITLNQMTAKAREAVGDKMYFDYNGFTNNCQKFIMYNLMNGLNVWNEQIKDFVMQDLNELSKEIPNATKAIMNTVTDIGQIADNVMGGGLVIHAIKIHHSIPKNEQIKHVQNISKSKKKRLSKPYGEYTSYRIIPKTKFIKSSYRTKSVMNGKIKLIFGKLKSNN
jgi:DNA-directed RNA polymerase subunit H (RpoH/RPB5)